MSESYLPWSAAELLSERLRIPVDFEPDAEPRPGEAATGLLRLGGPRRFEPPAVPAILAGRVWELRVRARTAWPHGELEDAAAAAQRSRGQPLILVARSFDKDELAQLRGDQVSHVDLKGNVFIRAEGLYLWLPADRSVRGRRPPRKQLNPFSKRSSLVVRALLEYPEHRWGVRELASDLNISIGHVSDVLRSLVESGYAVAAEGKWQLGDAVALLREWVHRYDWRENEVRSFVVPFEPGEIVSRVSETLNAGKVRYALTLLSGADQVAPQVQHGQTHLYIEPGRLQAAVRLVREGMFAEPASGGGSLHLLDPYYGRAALYGQQEVDGVPIVSNVQLFLDLLRFPLRGAEAARALALGPLAAQLGLDRRDAAALASLAE